MVSIGKGLVLSFSDKLVGEEDESRQFPNAKKKAKRSWESKIMVGKTGNLPIQQIQWLMSYENLY